MKQDDECPPSDSASETWLSEHTLAMRRAVEYCQELMRASQEGQGPAWRRSDAFGRLGDLIRQARQEAMDIHQLRQQYLENLQQQRFQRNAAPLPVSTSIEERPKPNEDFFIMDLIEADDVLERKEGEHSFIGHHLLNNPVKFQRRFLHANRPCLIRAGKGDGRQSQTDDGNKRSSWLETCFGRVRSQWVQQAGTRSTPPTATNDPSDRRSCDHNDPSSSICRDWFCDHVGPQTLVPVRAEFRSAPAQASSRGSGQVNDHGENSTSKEVFDPGRQRPMSMDELGRAFECRTLPMTMESWIEYLLQKQEHPSRCTHAFTANDPGNDREDDLESYFYLKDWHLQLFLQQQQQLKLQHEQLQSPEPEKQDHITASRDMVHANLYSIPPIFPLDLLNHFLTRFTQGDYRFVYWGPAGSTTSWHSDVLNSFSWSYNVHGTKQWTFLLPQPVNHQRDAGNTSTKEEFSANTLTVLQHAGDLMFVPAGWKHCVLNVEETLSINHNWITTANLDLTWECIVTEMEAVRQELSGWGITNDSWEAQESMLRGCTGLDVTAFFLMMLTRLLELWLGKQDVTIHEQDDETWQRHFDLRRLSSLLHTLLSDQNKVNLLARLRGTLDNSHMASLAFDMASKTLEDMEAMMSML